MGRADVLRGQQPEVQALVLDLAGAVLDRTAPEERALLPETSAEFFEDPDEALRAAQAPPGEEQLGFGLELALITPYVLAVVTPVVQFLLDLASDVLKDEIKPDAARWVRRVLHRPEPDAPTPAAAGATRTSPGLSSEQVRTVRRIAYDRAVALGVSDDQATVLADAVAGGVLLAG